MKEVELQDVVEIIAGQSPKSEFYNESGEGVPFFQGKTDFGDNYPTITTWCTKPKKMAKKGDILFSVRAPVGPTNIAKVDCCIGRGLSAIRPGEKIDRSYLRYFFKKVEEKISDQGRGSTFKAITQKDLKALKIPLPSLSEQKAIVAKLDHAQRLIDIDREMLAKYDELIQSVFLEMFGDPVTVSIEDDNTFELDELADFKGGGTPSKKNKDFWGGDIPWVSPKDMKWTFINNSQDKITSIAIEESSTKLIKSGAVISVVRSGILKNTWPLAINTVDVTLNQDMKALICSEKINNYFLLYYLKNYSRKILGTVRGTTADNISTKVFKNIPIKLPELEKQLVFMRIVKAIMKEKKATKYKKSEELFSSLVQGVFN